LAPFKKKVGSDDLESCGEQEEKKAHILGHPGIKTSLNSRNWTRVTDNRKPVFWCLKRLSFMIQFFSVSMGGGVSRGGTFVG
jgi:hypothetical protein